MHAVMGSGRLIAGRYRLQGPIGRGAMGIVWRGRDELLARDVAVKEVQIAAHASPSDAEAIYQFGQFGAGNIRAWRFAAEGSRQLPSRAWHPRIALDIDVASGDKATAASRAATAAAAWIADRSTHESVSSRNRSRLPRYRASLSARSRSSTAAIPARVRGR